MRAVIAFAVLLGFAVSPAIGQSHALAAKRVRILFIGNSYTYFNDLPGTLQAMAKAGNVAVEVRSVVAGGATLEQHWNERGTVDLIRRGAWDFVVLQEQSLLPIQRPRDLITYGTHFGKVIRASKARPVLYLTWSRKGRPTAQDSLNRAYLQLAREIGATIVPVGPAWRELERLDGSVDLYAEDGSHPSPLGSLVAASAFHRVLFGTLPTASFAAGAAATPRTLALVQRAVEAAVARIPSR